MKILFLSLYYYPDLSAGSFRATSLISKLLELGEEDLHIDLITTAPNRYNTYSPEFKKKESHKRLTINRIRIPSHKSGIFDQAWSYMYFALNAYKISRYEQYDLVFATSSRLMTAVLASFFKIKFKAVLYLDIRDLFTDTLKDLFKKKILILVVPFVKILESWSFRKADKINIVSQGFHSYVSKFSNEYNISVHTNGIDSDFLKKDYTKYKSLNTSLPIILYAGNIGEGQGLHNILPITAKYFEGKVEFHIFGDGGVRNKLEEQINLKDITNIKIFNPISRDDLIIEYSKADILFLHLNDFSAFKKVLPSKLFEYAATGKPIIAGVSGYSAEFIKKELPDVGLFNPCDHKNLSLLINNFLLKEKKIDREKFLIKYSRDDIMTKMASDILNTI